MYDSRSARIERHGASQERNPERVTFEAVRKGVRGRLRDISRLARSTKGKNRQEAVALRRSVTEVAKTLRNAKNLNELHKVDESLTNLRRDLFDFVG